MQLLDMLGGLGVFSIVPLVLIVLAIIDIVRTGAPWYWIWVVLMFPLAGSIAYFVVMRGPWSVGSLGRLSPDAARRQQAQRRLRELGVQLAHWRGPALLVEAGEELLVLGKTAEAEGHLREALATGADPADVAYPLSQALAVQGRFADAVPLLEPLVKSKPDARFGAVQLQLARCYDEAGQATEAERELRALLERRNFFEAKLRLARLLLRRGSVDEAQPLLGELKTSAAQLPAFVRRQQRPWINAARRLKRGDEALPKPQVEGAVPPGQRLRLALLAAGGLLLLGGMAAAFVAFTGVLSWARVADLSEREVKLREQLAALDRDPGAARAATGELDQDTVTAYLALRRRLDPTARAYAAQLTYPAAERSGEKEDDEDDEGVMPADAMRLHERRTAAKIAVLSETVAALRQQHLSSAAFSELLTTVEWRCLKRPQARLLSIAPHFRGEWQAAKTMLAAQEQNEQLLAERGEGQAAGGPAPANDPAAARSGLREAAAQDDAAGAADESAATDAERVQAAVATWKEQVARTRADAEARIRDMERLADAAPPLSAAAQQVCEANRTALQEPAAEATVALACALDPQLNCF